MGEEVAGFYDELAEHYHLIFPDWERSIERQAGVLGPLLEKAAGAPRLRILDCTCGIGTQAIGLARRGHAVVGSDLSEAAIRRAQREAKARGVEIRWHVADVRDLSGIAESGFDAVVTGDNSLPHLLTRDDLDRALAEMYGKLKPGGVLLAAMRDYDRALQQRPTVEGPVFLHDEGRRRIVHQIWDWEGEQYTLHLYLTWDTGTEWVAKHFVSRYRAVRREEMTEALGRAGFGGIEWQTATTGFYQPVVMARKEVGEG